VVSEPARGTDSLLRLTLDRPTPATTVVTVAGELDFSTAPRLAAVLETRLESAVKTVVVDLSAVTFIGSAGLEVLAQAHLRASLTGRAVRLVTGSHCVDRALHITGLDRKLPCHTDLTQALSSHDKPAAVSSRAG
jgi:anti-anti-sigma factor